MKADNPLKTRARRVVRELAKLYPEVECALHYDNPLQLLVSTILSAQCTDVRVNQVTPALFARYPDAAAFAGADKEELERLIHPTGFFRNKARNLMRCCQQLVEKHNGQVPRTMAELVKLPSIGRKTANVILGNAFAVPGIPVDTHVGRLSRRLGLSVFLNPVKVERDLVALLPEKDWTNFGHRLIFHGRQVCHSRKPRCGDCTLARLCPQVGVKTNKEEPVNPPSTTEAAAS